MKRPAILITEDESITALDIREKLETFGYSITSIATTSQEAIASVTLQRPDLVLMDIVIQGNIDGIETARIIQTEFAIPVIFLTAHADRQTLKRAKSAVPYGYIVKPFKDDELFSAIEMALHKHGIEKKFKESEKKYRELVENANSIILRMDAEWKITFFNEFAQSFFGYTAEEVLGKSGLGTIVPMIDSQGRDLSELLQDIIQNPEKYSSNENENIKKSGERAWISWNNRVITDPETGMKEILCVGIDITKRRILEENLRRSEDKFYKIFQSSPDSMAISTIDSGTLIDVNEEFIRKTGYSREEIIGKTSIELNLWPEKSIRGDILNKISKGEPIRNLEIKFNLKEGTLDTLFSAERIEIEGRPCLISIIRDITELRKAHEERKEAIGRLNDIIEFLPDATFVIDRNKRVIAWNRAMELLTGVHKADILGKSGHEYSLPLYGYIRPILIDLLDSPERLDDMGYENVAKEGNILYAESYSPLLRSGSGAYLWGKASPIRDSSGNMVGGIEAIRDITALKETEKALKESEEKFHRLFDQSEDGQLILEDNVFIDCNHSALRLLGYSDKKDILGKHPSDISPEHQPDGTLSVIQDRNNITQALRKGSVNFEWDFFQSNGRIIPIEITLTTISVHGKKLFHAACRDITVRKYMEAELRMSEEKYRTIFETSGTAMIIFDNRMTITLMNRRMEQLTGFSREEIEGKRKWTDFVQEEELDMLMKYQKRSMKDPKSAPFQVEFSYINKSGEVRECIGNFSIISDTNLHVGSILDITERRKLTREILQISAEEQQRIGRDLHDGLGQHLTGIAFMSKVLESKLKEKKLGEIEDATKITDLINMAIDVTRILSKGLNPVSLEKRGLMDALEELAMNTEELFGISCRLHCDCPIQIQESSVALHVYYIVKEAVNNAVKHSHAKVIEIAFHQDKDTVSFMVRDDGTGFHEGTRAGKGLGLNLMRHRADIINATFEILHPENGGTIVSCSFRNRKRTSRDS